MRVRARAQADLAALALRHRVLVLVEDLHVPARHRLAHRALADLHERVVGDQRIGLGEPVVVEHREPVLLAEPADRLRVQRLARRAHAAELLRVARARVGDRHHRAHRGRRREDVGRLVAGQEVELLVRVEPALALIHELHGAEPPRPEQRRDAGRPRPLAHAVEALAVLHVVAVDELLVREQVAVRVQDALGEARGAGGVVELRRVVGRGVDRLERRVAAGQQVLVEDQDLVGLDAVRVGLVGDEDLRLRSRRSGGGCRRRRRAPTSRAGSRRPCRCRRRRRRSRGSAAAASRRGHPALHRGRAARSRSGSTTPAARPSGSPGRCPRSPRGSSRACPAGACRSSRPRCCSARGRATRARRRLPRRSRYPGSSLSSLDVQADDTEGVPGRRPFTVRSYPRADVADRHGRAAARRRAGDGGARLPDHPARRRAAALRAGVPPRACCDAGATRR